MANWAGAIETLGKGLFDLGKVRLQKEENEIAYMRQKALQELGIQAQKDLQAQNQDFLAKQAAAGREHDQTMLTTQAGLNIAMQERGWTHDQAMAAQRQGWEAQLAKQSQDFQLELQKYKTIEDVQAAGTRQLSTIDGRLWELKQDLDKLDPMDPASEQVAANLKATQELLQRSRVDIERETLQRVDAIHTGGTSRSGLTPEDVRRRLAQLDGGAKGKGPADAEAAKTQAPAGKTSGPPAGAYTGGSSAPQAAPQSQAPLSQQGSTLFDKMLAPSSTQDVNAALGRKIGGAVTGTLFDSSSQTGQINKELWARMRGITVEELDRQLAAGR